MSIATGIQSLRVLVEDFDGRAAATAAEIVAALRAVAAAPDAQECRALAELTEACAVSIEALMSDEQLSEHGSALKAHLDELLAFAELWLAAREAGADDGAAPSPPAPFAVTSKADQQQFADAVGMFVGNALGALGDLEEELLSIEAAGDRLEEALAGVRRTVHTLKAEFGVLNLAGPQTLCHQAETTLDAVVERGVSAPVDLLLAFTDLVKQFVERLAQDVHATFEDPQDLLGQLQQVCSAPAAGGVVEGRDEPVPLEVDGDFADSLPEFVSEARAHLADAEVAMVELSREPDNVENLNLTFRAFHTIKGVAGFLNLTAVVELAHVAETLLDGGRSGRFLFDGEDIDLVLAAGDMITQMIAALEGQDAPTIGEWQRLKAALAARADREGDAAPAQDAPAASEPAPQEPPPPEQSSDAGSGAAPEKATDAESAVVKPQPPAKSKTPAKTPAKAARVERTIKVSTTRLDMLVDMVGELVIAQSMVLQDPAIQELDSQVLSRNIGQVGKITRDLQEAAMSLRMVTVKSTFQKMARLVRDVASKSGKRVNLVIQGEDTELDRNVVEQISDPLVHMIRNAVDHGIELPKDRGAANKDEEGQLSLSAYHQGGSIVIEIQDDGRGIDRDKVFEKARAKGLVPADANPQTMSDGEVFNMIFLPGFSTAEQVTDLSGRGVGMDVVRRNIEALRGKIEIESTLGEGTTFRMRLPLTLAIIDGMIVRVGKSRYVVPTLSIEQSFRPDLDDVHHVVDRGECVRVRGAVLPVYRLKELFGQRDGADALEEGILVVVEVDGQRSCLFVDEIVGQQQVVIKSLGMSRDRVVGLSGGAIMTDGRVALIIDVSTLVESILPV